ncbi:MAG: neutral/alkaline non-lysosomal ceramidase N-terminal domain-containing protein [Planctomycetia bacterium]|nr:neutral/alkaline non-lysosomal ceramidase N-terminal domain-containing protein [Planctomycetia bacterium]
MKMLRGWCLWLLACSALCAGEVPLECGFAKVDITPPLSFPMAGYYRVRLSTGTSDPLFARAMAFRQGENEGVLLICDTISINELVTKEIRRRVKEKTGISESAIVITATHTHTGPARDVFNPKVTPEMQAEAIRENNWKKFNYSCFWADRGTEAILAAVQNRKPVRLGFARTEIDDLSFNRRFFMKNQEEVVFNPGIQNPNILRAAGPIDPEVSILVFKEEKTERAMASLTSFALHLDTTGGTLFSADYPYYLSEVLKEKYGADFLSFFGTGACGDINHIDVTGTHRRKAPQIGEALGRRVVEAMEKGVTSEPASFAVASRVVLCPRQQFTEEEIAAAAAMRDAIMDPSKGKYTFLERVRAGKILGVSQLPENVACDVQAFRFSEDVAMVALPGEVFVELGLAIKKASPFKHTIVLELSQRNLQYVPTEKAFREGSYETINSTVAPGGGEKLVEAAVALLRSLK